MAVPGLLFLGFASQGLAQETDDLAADSVRSAAAVPMSGQHEQARALLDSLRWSSDSLKVLEKKLLDDPETDVSFGRVQALKYARQQHRSVIGLADLLRRTSRDSLPVDFLTAELRAYIMDHLAVLDRGYARQVGQYEVLRRQRAMASAEESGPLEARIADVREWGDTLIVYKLAVLEAAEGAGLDAANEWAELDEFLSDRAERQVGRLQIAISDRDRLEERIATLRRTSAPEAEIAGLQRRVSSAQSRIDAIAASLGVTNELLQERGFETVAYRGILIRATGEVSGDVLDPKVLSRLARDLAIDGWRWGRDNAATLLARVLILIGFVLLFRLLFRLGWWLARALRLVKGSRLFADTLGRSLRPLATLLGIGAGLSVIGVQTTTLLAGLGVAGLVVGFALQDSLSNLFAGVAILATRPYDVDDIVEAGGVVGRVRAMDLWNTTIVTFDARRLLVPNNSIWSKIIENRSAEPVRRVEALARIGYDDDLDGVMEVLLDLLRSDDRVLDEPAPSAFVTRLGESWIEVKLWPWVKNADWWSLTADLPRLVRQRLASENIPIPYPRREILGAGGMRTEGLKSGPEGFAAQD